MSSNTRKPNRRSITAQALGWIDGTTRALVPPIHTSTNYERSPDGSWSGAEYTRDDNPTYLQAEALLAELEGAEEALLFASGMAAATAVIDALGPASRVIAPQKMYWSLRHWLQERAESGAIRLELVDNGDSQALEAALASEPTRLVWIETPANPTLDVTDIRETVDLAHAAGAVVVADSTLATPVHTRPLDLGVDIVMHSATKQLNGHGDVLAGALATAADSDLWRAIRGQRSGRGGVLGPFEAWLLLRGMRTLFLRVEASSANAQRVAEALEARSEVRAVYYPGLRSHPGHEVARSQMTGGFGSMVSFCVGGDAETALRIASSMKLFKQATSLGHTESLVEHRASVEGPSSPVPGDLLRLSVGIEDVSDLIDDLYQAIDDAA